MLLKWIICSVPEPLKNSFAQAQREWHRLAAIPGFLGQIGGWNDTSNVDAAGDASLESCILSIWQDDQSYREFMDQFHDEIFLKSRQSTTFKSIDVLFLKPVHVLPGRHQNMLQSFAEAGALRAADLLVNPEREQHFVEVRENIWTPAMGQAEGMLAGGFSKVIGDDSRYIVTTLWQTVDAHDSYVRNTLPAVRQAANFAQDVEQLTGRLVILEGDWLVVPQ